MWKVVKECLDAIKFKAYTLSHKSECNGFSERNGGLKVLVAESGKDKIWKTISWIFRPKVMILLLVFLLGGRSLIRLIILKILRIRKT